MLVNGAQGERIGSQYVGDKMTGFQSLALQTQSVAMLAVALKMGVPNLEASLQFAEQARNFKDDPTNRVEVLTSVQIGKTNVDIVVERNRYQVRQEDGRMVPTSLYGKPEQRATLWIDPRLEVGDAVTMVVDKVQNP